jgi:outer membrane protein assembly factor BamD (BamD/ComL family)
MLAKDPAQRYRSMQRVLDDLDRCAQSVKTSHAEMVPFGTDSAFARTYELPQTKASSVRGRLPAGTLLAAAIVVAALVGLAGYFVGRGSPETPQGRVERPPQGAPGVSPTPSAAFRQEPGPLEPAEAPEQTPAQRELAARKALEQAQTDWQRYSQSNDYEMGLTAFRDVASKYADTAYAARSQEQMARIYTEWARASAAAGNHEEAVERYRKALEVAPEGSSFADLARRVLPSAMADLAESARVRGQYDRALSLYDEMANQYPGTKEAALVQARKPETQLSQAFVLWKDRQEFDAALTILMQVVKGYPETKWAAQAKQAMPTLYLDTIRMKLDQGKLLDARRQLQELVEAYPGHQAAQDAADMDAELLFRLLEKARAEGKDADAAGPYGELLRRYPSSQWSVKAAGLALKLPAAQWTAYDERTAQNQLKEALRRREALDFKDAMGTLKGLMRYARPDSAVAAEALAKLPAWMYESALYAHGQGAAEECLAMLAEVSAQFPQTAWDARAVQTRQRLSTPPEGMVYVPEGLFQMGTDMSELVALLKPYGPTAWAEDDEAARAFAEASELVN